MADYQITCITKDDRNSPYERIQGVGGPQLGFKTLDEAIAMVERGDRLWVAPPGLGRSVWVHVAKGPSGRKYLKTDADGAEPNNLLSLPNC